MLPIRPNAWLVALIVLLLLIAVCLFVDHSLVDAAAARPDGFAHTLLGWLSSRILGGLAFVAACALLWREGRRHEAWLLGAATALALALSFAVKTVIGRPRPAFAELAGETGASFPSSHAAGAVAIALIAARAWPRQASTFLAAASVYALMRIGLGLHYASDVLGGAVVGTASSLAALLAYERWQAGHVGGTVPPVPVAQPEPAAAPVAAVAASPQPAPVQAPGEPAPRP